MRQSITVLPSYGILTICPSHPALAICLGPTNPTLINIAWETLVFRWEGLSPSLRLLVQAFVLPHAPVWVTPLPSTQSGTLSYRLKYLNYKPAVSVVCFSPDHLWRRVSRWVRCYSFFQWWLLLSQHPHCQWNSTSLLTLSIHFGTLTCDQGCFPFDHRSFAPGVLLLDYIVWHSEFDRRREISPCQNLPVLYLHT